MQTLTIKIDDDYLEKITNFLKKIPQNKIKIINNKAVNNSNVFGLLKGRMVDPVKWQQELRTENDRRV